MNPDFHYYATYGAAILAGYSHEEAQEAAWCAQFVDLCSVSLLSKLKAPRSAATSQLNMELMDANTDINGLQEMTRIWSSFHFLPRDLYAEPEGRCSGLYKSKYRLICGPNGELLSRTVELAKGGGIQAIGLSMHVLADSWAHRYFAGTPSLVINSTNRWFYEVFPDGSEKRITFRHSVSAQDDLENSIYTSSLGVSSENHIMNLGHGRAGHLPDYCFIRYRYMPAWGGYREIVKDNPSDFRHAFCQMIYAMKYLRGEHRSFECERYDFGAAASVEADIDVILSKRQTDAGADWKALGEKLSGRTVEPFDIEKYQAEYAAAPKDEKDRTFLGGFILAALKQKSMLTHSVWESGNRLAGRSIEYGSKGLRGIKDYFMLAGSVGEEEK